jgi:hypothetical protein
MIRIDLTTPYDLMDERLDSPSGAMNHGSDSAPDRRLGAIVGSSFSVKVAWLRARFYQDLS